MSNLTVKRLIKSRDEIMGLWNTERLLYGVASDETERQLAEARRDLFVEQQKEMKYLKSLWS